MARAPRRASQPQIIYQRVDDACTYMLKITYYPDTYERTREVVSIADVPPQFRCSASSPFGRTADNYVRMASNIVSAYVKNNSVAVSELPMVIQSVHGSICGLNRENIVSIVDTDRKTSSEISKSVRPDAIISFIDGRPYKTLKRHLSSHGMNIDEYRDKFGLPDDYPTIAADYAAQRSRLAKSLGLGRTASLSSSREVPREAEVVTTPVRRRRGPRSS